MQTTQRAAGAAQLAQQKYGCSLQTYWTVGVYDVVYILEAPNDESALVPSCWRSAPGESSGRLRFAPTTAKRCRASLGGLADPCAVPCAENGASSGPEWLRAPSFLMPLFTELPRKVNSRKSISSILHRIALLDARRPLSDSPVPILKPRQVVWPHKHAL
jgi:hypothetical protein